MEKGVLATNVRLVERAIRLGIEAGREIATPEETRQILGLKGRMGLEERRYRMEIFEAIMVICFGLSWPLSVYKSWKSRTAKGKSLLFEVFIAIGYVSGIIGKIVGATVYDKPITYVFIFYIINICMVTVDIILYIRNVHLDKVNGAK